MSRVAKTTDKQTGAHCHKHVAKIAKEAASASYDELMSQDILYSAWKKSNPDCVNGPTVNSVELRRRFVARNWGKYIPLARTTLGLLLSQPIDNKLKDEIVEILALDQTLIKGRVNPAVIAGSVQQKG